MKHKLFNYYLEPSWPTCNNSCYKIIKYKIKKRNKPQADQCNNPKINEEMLDNINADQNIQQKNYRINMIVQILV